MKKHLTLSLLCLGVVLSSSSCGNKYRPAFDPDAQQIVIGDSVAVAATQYGKVKGYISRGVFTFLGIPYGASTEGENRFMPPQPPHPWEGILPTVYYGDSAPQRGGSFSSRSYNTFQDHWNYDGISEDCLRLNVWSPALDAAHRPVIVWLHGGGFSSGNAIEQDGYHGENFARRQDAVFVSINHRLNSFGFSDFAAVGGEKYKHSANVGMLDIVAALRWVKANIASFGGDPDNVTIIGQSGGGSKVCLTATMPSAKGLVQKAVALSGNTTVGANKEAAEALGAAILEEAGLEPSEIDQLQQMPWKEYYELSHRVASRMKSSFRPVADDVDIPIGTFYTLDNPALPDIPMMFCTTSNEFTTSRDNPELEKNTREDVIALLAKSYGDNSAALYDSYAELFPEASPFGVYSAIRSSRANVIRTANAKLHQQSPVYLAWFTWCPPNFDGRQMSFHCLDICFWFYNTDLMLSHTGGGKIPRTLSAKMSDALNAFMRTGDPNTGNKNGLPPWPIYTESEGATMILDNKPRVANAPDAKGLELMKK